MDLFDERKRNSDFGSNPSSKPASTEVSVQREILKVTLLSQLIENQVHCLVELESDDSL